MTDRKRNILLLILSLAAGCVDSIAFLNTGTFPANMTGNSVMLGMALVHANVDHAALSFLALAGYAAGVMGSAWLMPSTREDRQWTPQISFICLGAGSILLLSVIFTRLLPQGGISFLIIPAALAMGMQSAAVLRLGVAGVSTTVVSGTLTTGLARLVEGVRGRKTPGPIADRPWLPLLSWALYLGGAVIGAAQDVWQQNWILLLPGTLLMGVGFGGGIRKRPLPESPARP